MVEGKEIQRDFNWPIKGNEKFKGKNAKEEISMSKILSVIVSKARGRIGTVRNNALPNRFSRNE